MRPHIPQSSLRNGRVLTIGGEDRTDQDLMKKRYVRLTNRGGGVPGAHGEADFSAVAG